MAAEPQLRSRRRVIAVGAVVAVVIVAVVMRCGADGTWSMPDRQADVPMAVATKWIPVDECGALCTGIEDAVGAVEFEVLDHPVSVTPNETVSVVVSERTGWFSCGADDAREDRSSKDALSALRWNARQTTSAARYGIWFVDGDVDGGDVAHSGSLPVALTLFEGSCG